MEQSPDPDAQLMLRVRNGDREAFAELVDKYKQPVMNLVWSLIRDASEAEDLAQHVFLQVYKASARYRVSARFSTWLFTIARNMALNEIRRRRRHPAEPLEIRVEDSSESIPRPVADKGAFTAPDQLLQDELFEKIDEALADLPEKQRTALVLCREGEHSYEEIARILGTSVSATKSLIHRARETMKERLKPYLKSGAWTSG